MFERFTDKARSAVVLAQEEARVSGWGELQTQHLLLGIYRVEDGLGGQVLHRLLDGAAPSEVAHRFESGPGTTGANLEWTVQLRAALDAALREALAQGHNWIGTEHLLLGLCRNEKLELWEKLGLDPIAVRQMVMLAVNGPEIEPEPEQAPDAAIEMLREYQDGIKTQIQMWQRQIEEREAEVDALDSKINDGNLRLYDIERALSRLRA